MLGQKGQKAPSNLRQAEFAMREYAFLWQESFEFLPAMARKNSPAIEGPRAKTAKTAGIPDGVHPIDETEPFRKFRKFEKCRVRRTLERTPRVRQ
jgi:hypothetical protein